MLLPALFIPDRLPASLFFAIRISEPEYIKSTWSTTWYMQWHEQVTGVSRPALPVSGTAWLDVPWRQKQLVPPKHRQICNWALGVTSHITLFFSILTRLQDANRTIYFDFPWKHRLSTGSRQDLGTPQTLCNEPWSLLKLRTPQNDTKHPQLFSKERLELSLH